MSDVMPVYAPLPKQLEWHKSTAPVTFLVGGVGSGKTLALCHEALKMARINAGLPGLVSAPTYMMLRDIDIETFFGKVCPREKVDFNKQEYKATFPNGSSIFFRSLDNPDRIRGLEVAWGLIDEACHCTLYGFDVLLGRVRHPQAKLLQTKCIGNPAGFNWVHERCIEHPRPGYKLLRTTTFDNPHLSRQYIETLQGSYSEKFADQELRGEFISLEGLVYPFSRQLHVISNLREKVEASAPDALLYGGLDFGWTDPTALLDFRVNEFAAREGKRKVEVYLVDEFYETGCSADKLAARIKSKPYEWIAHDPAGKQARQEAEGKSMIKLLRTRQVNNLRTRHYPLLGGIRLVSSYFQNDLGEVRFYIDARCVNTIRELSSYSWKVTPEGKANKEAPQEHDDHACDAIRYFYINKFQDVNTRFDI